MSKKKINIGLDLGIGSVGWAVVNAEEFEIIDAGVRLFPEAGKESENSAASRREKRSSRRMHRRSRLRLDTLLKYFVKYGFLNEVNDFYKIKQHRFASIAELKQYALTNPISLNEMMILLYHSVKKRGVFNFKQDVLENKMKDKKTGEIELSSDDLEKELEEKSKKLPSELQIKNFEENGKITGSDNRFPHEMFKKELEQIISFQKENGRVKLPEEFVNDFFVLFSRKREYWEGPSRGNSQSKSLFSWQTGKGPQKDQEEFYDRLIGKDSYDRSQPRAPKKGMYAALFNLLNDLNNLNLSGINRENSKITKEEKMKVIESLFPKTKVENLTLKKLAKILECEEKEIEGYRIEGTKKVALFTKFEALNDIFNTLKKVGLDTSWLSYENRDLIDEVIVILTKSQDIVAAEDRLSIFFRENNFEFASKMAKQLSVLTSKNNGSHALSNKTILKVYDIMLNEPLNSQLVFKENNILKDYKFNFSNEAKYIPVLEEEINNLFISPVVKRTLIQALKVLRAIQIEFRDYEIDSISIELAREKNSEDERKYITLVQELNKKANDKIANLLGLENVDEIPGKLLAKLSLYLEQDSKCVYCGRAIDLEDLKWSPEKYEIDHIIPESISFNTKRDNLVLVHSTENNDKKNLTAYHYINSDKSKLNYSEFLTLINRIYDQQIQADKTKTKQLRQKIANLTNSTDFENDENSRLAFVNRNLVDTRYATSEIYAYLDELRHNLKNSPLNNVKLKVLNGSHTDFIKRSIFHLPTKNRNDFRHHGIDAITIAYSDIITQDIRKTSRKNKDENAVKLVSQKYDGARAQILDHDYHFSKKTNTNFNRQLSNDTLYSFKKYDGEFRQMMKVNLTDVDPGTMNILKNMFSNEADSKNHVVSLIELHDSETFNYLKKIYNAYPIGHPYKVQYKNSKGEISEREEKIRNPFLYFKIHENQKIYLQKNTKNPEKNPEIKSIRYYGNKIGKLLDVSEKYNVDATKTKIGFTSLKPIRLDLYQNKLTNKYKIFPVNARVIKAVNEKEIIIDDFKYRDMVSSKSEGFNINLNEFEKVLELFPRGTTVRITSQDLKYDNEVFEVVGSGHIGKIELDFINKRKDPADKIRIEVAVGTLTKIEKVHTNILGTKRKYITKENFPNRKIQKSIEVINEKEYNKNV